MKILVVGDGIGEDIYDGAIANAFLQLGHNVQRFTWKEYFKLYPYKKEFKLNNEREQFEMLKSIYYRLQNRFLLGPEICRINKDLLKVTQEFKPELIFIYRGTHILPNTIKALKNINTKVFAYNNDDPFSSQYPKYLWRHYVKSLKLYDHVFYYRDKNRIDLEELKCRNHSLLRSYYLCNKNYPIDTNYTSDVLFIGHFENDGRDDAMKMLIEHGVSVNIYGSLWDKSKHYKFFTNYLKRDIKPVFGDSYNVELNKSKIVLVFYSKLNNDTYTRRCFEIPATSKLMLAEYTDDMNHNLFKESIDADYFRDNNELLKKVYYYLSNDDEYIRVSNSGYLRLKQDGHEVKDRASQVICTYLNDI